MYFIIIFGFLQAADVTTHVQKARAKIWQSKFSAIKMFYRTSSIQPRREIANRTGRK